MFYRGNKIWVRFWVHMNAITRAGQVITSYKHWQLWRIHDTNVDWTIYSLLVVTII